MIKRIKKPKKMAIQFKQRCVKCKKVYVLTSSRNNYVLCYDCQKDRLKGVIKDKKMKALMDISEEFYKNNSFLRDLKINCLTFGSLTEKQVEAFKRTVERMKHPEVQVDPSKK